MRESEPVYVISVAAELAGMHAQTLRQYDRLGLVIPSRAPGKARRYSPADIEMLRQVQALSQEGVSLEGIKRILDMQRELLDMRERMNDLGEELAQLRSLAAQHAQRIFAAGLGGDITAVSLGERPRARSTLWLELERPNTS